jgi:hypothetical protein
MPLPVQLAATGVVFGGGATGVGGAGVLVGAIGSGVRDCAETRVATIAAWFGCGVPASASFDPPPQATSSETTPTPNKPSVIRGSLNKRRGGRFIRSGLILP